MDLQCLPFSSLIFNIIQFEVKVFGNFVIDFLGTYELMKQQIRKNECKKVFIIKMSLVVRKPVFGVSHQVRHKPGCTTTEDGWTLEISDLGRRGIVLSV